MEKQCQVMTMTRRGSGSSRRSCFYCFQKGRKCEHATLEGPCLNCRYSSGVLASIHLVPCLHESEVRAFLDDLVSTTSHLPFRFPQAVDAILCISIITQSKYKGKFRPKKSNTQIPVTGSFFPHNLGLCGQMDIFVQNTLSLRMEGVDPTSNWVQNASLAGGYLALIFPVAETAGSANNLSINSSSVDGPEQHIVNFSLLRFNELLDSIIVALRSLNFTLEGQNNALNAIAAAGVLYFELEDINQRFQSGTAQLLCNHPELEAATRGWLKLASKEILTRLQTTCGHCPNWAKNLVPPCKGAKRNFNILSITLTMSTPSESNFIHEDVDIGPFNDSQTISTGSILSPFYINLEQTQNIDEYETQAHAPIDKESLWFDSSTSKLGNYFIRNKDEFPESNQQSSALMNSKRDENPCNSKRSTILETYQQENSYLLDSGPFQDYYDFEPPITTTPDQRQSFNGQYPTSTNDHNFSPNSSFGVGEFSAISPTLQVLGTSNDFPSEIEQFAHHVSGPLPFTNGTREETSVEATDDLFPFDLQY